MEELRDPIERSGWCAGTRPSGWRRRSSSLVKVSDQDHLPRPRAQLTEAATALRVVYKTEAEQISFECPISMSG